MARNPNLFARPPMYNPSRLTETKSAVNAQRDCVDDGTKRPSGPLRFSSDSISRKALLCLCAILEFRKNLFLLRIGES